MKLSTTAFEDNQAIPARYAMGKPDPDTHATFSDNINPALSWSDLPADTQSLILVCHDPDVPSKGDDVNQERREVPAELTRVDFYHWVLVDLAPQPGSIAEGEFSKGVTVKGKAGPEGPRGTRQGINNYSDWFAGNADMAGDYFGYDGPFPPWNDSIMHHYVFTLYALDVERCPLEGKFSGLDVLKAIEGHVLGSASLTGNYSLNPDLSSQ